MNHPDTNFMQQALTLAQEAALHGDIPVGCVIVRDGQVVGRGRNRRELLGDATAHAELEAIREACSALGTWRLSDCTLYVTLEPCPMCAGGMINSRIHTVVYGAANPKAGCCGSVLPLFHEKFNHHPVIYGGVLEGECAQVLGEFFRPNNAN
jgi:tRNA(adenine34) deaminase